MRIRCENVQFDTFPVSDALHAWLLRSIHLPELPLDVGRTYLVYAMAVDDISTWYYILEEERDTYPKAYAAPFFSVVDPRPSSLWVERQTKTGRMLAFPAWFDDPHFYEHLIDGEEAQEKAFSEARARMDLEFDPPPVQTAAIALSDRWVQCPVCEEAWETDSREVLLRCINRLCWTLLLNPFAGRW